LISETGKIHTQHGKSIVIKGGEKNMDISTMKVKIVQYSNGLRFTAQFLPTFLPGVSLEGVR
jgi:hypothetical protein